MKVLMTNTSEGLIAANENLPQAKSSFIWYISFVAALGGLLFGFDTAIISGTIPYIKSFFNLNEYSLGWAVSSILLGCAAGALLAGSLADKYGRKFLLLICAVLFAMSGAGAGLSKSLEVFILFRLLGGLGVGAAAMISPMYIAEVAPASKRGRLVAIYQLAIVLGILLAYFSNFLLNDTGENNWRYMFASQVAPSLLFFVMLLFVPETPRWLVYKNRIHEAQTILQKTMGAGVEQEIIIIQKSFDQQHTTTLKDLFHSKYRVVLFIGITIAVAQQVTGINAVLYYAPVILRQTGLDTSSSLQQTIIIGIVNVISTFIAIGFVDKVGRKKFLMAGSGIMGISLVAIALCFQYNYFQNYVVLLFTILYVGAFGCTLGAVTWVYLSEIFPNKIRGMALATATLVLWLADFIVTYTFPLLTHGAGTAVTMLVYAAFCAASFVFIWLQVPETKGKSLEELEAVFIK